MSALFLIWVFNNRQKHEMTSSKVLQLKSVAYFLSRFKKKIAYFLPHTHQVLGNNFEMIVVALLE